MPRPAVPADTGFLRFDPQKSSLRNPVSAGTAGRGMYDDNTMFHCENLPAQCVPGHSVFPVDIYSRTNSVINRNSSLQQMQRCIPETIVSALSHSFRPFSRSPRPVPIASLFGSLKLTFSSLSLGCSGAVSSNALMLRLIRLPSIFVTLTLTFSPSFRTSAGVLILFGLICDT